MIKGLIVFAAVATPVAVNSQTLSDSYSIATACAGGAMISAMFKYREAAKAETKNNIAVADAVIAAVAGILVGWFGHESGRTAMEKIIGVSLSAPLTALILSLLGIKVIELIMTSDLTRFIPGAKKSV
jgi:uncharacterized protein YacL